MIFDTIVDCISGIYDFGKDLLFKGGKFIMSLFSETGAPNSIVNSMSDAGMMWDPTYSEKLFKGVTEGMASYLSTVKGETPKAVTLKDEDGKVIFGGMVEKLDADNGGGYGLTYFFNDDSLDDKVETVDIESPVAYNIIASTSFSTQDMQFQIVGGKKMLSTILRIAIKSLVEYIRNTYNDCKIIEVPNYFKIEASIDADNKLHLTLTPEAILKQYIKDDESISEATTA